MRYWALLMSLLMDQRAEKGPASRVNKILSSHGRLGRLGSIETPRATSVMSQHVVAIYGWKHTRRVELQVPVRQ